MSDTPAGDCDPSDTQLSADFANARPRRRIKWPRVLLLSGGILASGAALWNFRSNGDIPPPPIVDLRDTPAPVVATVNQARQALLAGPRSAETWGRYGMCLQAHGYSVAAVSCFERAEQLDPRDYRWPYLKGILVVISDPLLGASCFERASSLRPGLSYVRLRTAELLLDLNRPDQAGRHIQAVLATEPHAARAALAAARLAFLKHEDQKSLDWARKAAELAPNVRVTYELLAQVSFRTQDEAAARQYLALMRALQGHETDWPDPLIAQVMELRRDPHWVLFRAQQKAGAGRSTEALADLRNMIADQPDLIEFRIDFANLLLSVGELDEAAKVLDDGLQRHPRSPRLHRLRGLVHYANQQLPSAAREFQKAIEHKPDFAIAHYNLGKCLLELGDKQAAVTSFQQAVHFQPDLPGVVEELDRLQAGPEQ